MPNYTFPHPEIEVKAIGQTSAVADTVNEILHNPVFIITAPKGDINLPNYCANYSVAKSIYGADAFDPTSKYFQHQTLFAMIAAQYQPVTLIRVADGTVDYAGLVLTATVTQTNITQYQTDALGDQVRDASGNLVPLRKPDGSDVVETGVSIKWAMRALAEGETYTSIQTVVNENGSKTYPVIATRGTSPGTAISLQGFKLYYSSESDTSLMNRLNSCLFRFAPMVLSDGVTSTASQVTDIYGTPYNDISLKAVAVDPSTNLNSSMSAIVTNNYVDDDGVSDFGYDINVYSDNVAAIGNQVVAVSSELVGTSPYLINIVSGVDQSGNPYKHLTIDPASSSVVNQNVILYNQGGSDGDVSAAAFEKLVSAFVTGNDNVEMQDYFRYPMTHFYDSGFTTDTKYDFAGLLSLRDDIAIDFASQDISLPDYTQNQDQSAGEAIRAHALLYPESTLYGTECARAAVYLQTGILATPQGSVNRAVTVLDRMIKRCMYDCGTYQTGTPKGRPNSEITTFKSLSYSSATDTVYQLNWTSGLNRARYCTRTKMFYPDLRTVYPDETGILSDDVFKDQLIYIKRIVRAQWTIYAGVNTERSKLHDIISKSIKDAIDYAFNNTLTVTVSVDETLADQARGFSSTVTVSVLGNMPLRVWNVIVPVGSVASNIATSATSAATSV